MPLDELVEKIEGGSLRPRISPTGDRARLKTAITQLDARERAILTLMAEGKATPR
jgi:DNA-binding NarL/FixJ family response regulator